MSHVYQKTICDRCGSETYKRQFAIEAIMELGKIIKPGMSIDEYSDILSEITKAPKEVALEWSRHGMYKLCKEKKPIAPDAETN